MREVPLYGDTAPSRIKKGRIEVRAFRTGCTF